MTNILLDDVWFSYEGSQNNIFESLSWKWKTPGLIGILGSNGSGKSTLLKLLSGLIKPSAGKVVINEQRINENKKTKQKCIFVPENARLFLIGPTPRKDLLRSCNDTSIVNRVLNEYNLLQIADKKLYHLSEGQRRLIAIISALCSYKKVILLDEPTIGLDSIGRKILISLSDKTIAQNKIVIISTNDPRLFNHFNDILVLHNKKIHLQGPPSDVLFNLEEETGLLPNQTVRMIKYLEDKFQKNIIHHTNMDDFNTAIREGKIF